ASTSAARRTYRAVLLVKPRGSIAAAFLRAVLHRFRRAVDLLLRVLLRALALLDLLLLDCRAGRRSARGLDAASRKQNARDGTNRTLHDDLLLVAHVEDLVTLDPARRLRLDL